MQSERRLPQSGDKTPARWSSPGRWSPDRSPSPSRYVYVEDEWETKPKTDYTYARSPTYSARYMGTDVVQPNMSRYALWLAQGKFSPARGTPVRRRLEEDLETPAPQPVAPPENSRHTQSEVKVRERTLPRRRDTWQPSPVSSGDEGVTMAASVTRAGTKYGMLKMMRMRSRKSVPAQYFTANHDVTDHREMRTEFPTYSSQVDDTIHRRLLGAEISDSDDTEITFKRRSVYDDNNYDYYSVTTNVVTTIQSYLWLFLVTVWRVVTYPVTLVYHIMTSQTELEEYEVDDRDGEVEWEAEDWGKRRGRRLSSRARDAMRRATVTTTTTTHVSTEEDEGEGEAADAGAGKVRRRRRSSRLKADEGRDGDGMGPGAATHAILQEDVGKEEEDEGDVVTVGWWAAWLVWLSWLLGRHEGRGAGEADADVPDGSAGSYTSLRSRDATHARGQPSGDDNEWRGLAAWFPWRWQTTTTTTTTMTSEEMAASGRPSGPPSEQDAGYGTDEAALAAQGGGGEGWVSQGPAPGDHAREAGWEEVQEEEEGTFENSFFGRLIYALGVVVYLLCIGLPLGLKKLLGRTMSFLMMSLMLPVAEGAKFCWWQTTNCATKVKDTVARYTWRRHNDVYLDDQSDGYGLRDSTRRRSVRLGGSVKTAAAAWRGNGEPTRGVLEWLGLPLAWLAVAVWCLLALPVTALRWIGRGVQAGWRRLVVGCEGGLSGNSRRGLFHWLSWPFVWLATGAFWLLTLPAKAVRWLGEGSRTLWSRLVESGGGAVTGGGRRVRRACHWVFLPFLWLAWGGLWLLTWPEKAAGSLGDWSQALWCRLAEGGRSTVSGSGRGARGLLRWFSLSFAWLAMGLLWLLSLPLTAARWLGDAVRSAWSWMVRRGADVANGSGQGARSALQCVTIPLTWLGLGVLKVLSLPSKGFHWLGDGARSVGNQLKEGCRKAASSGGRGVRWLLPWLALPFVTLAMVMMWLLTLPVRAWRALSSGGSGVWTQLATAAGTGISAAGQGARGVLTGWLIRPALSLGRLAWWVLTLPLFALRGLSSGTQSGLTSAGEGNRVLAGRLKSGATTAASATSQGSRSALVWLWWLLTLPLALGHWLWAGARRLVAGASEPLASGGRQVLAAPAAVASSTGRGARGLMGWLGAATTWLLAVPLAVSLFLFRGLRSATLHFRTFLSRGSAWGWCQGLARGAGRWVHTVMARLLLLDVWVLSRRCGVCCCLPLLLLLPLLLSGSYSVLNMKTLPAFAGLYENEVVVEAGMGRAGLSAEEAAAAGAAWLARQTAGGGETGAGTGAGTGASVAAAVEGQQGLLTLSEEQLAMLKENNDKLIVLMGLYQAQGQQLEHLQANMAAVQQSSDALALALKEAKESIALGAEQSRVASMAAIGTLEERLAGLRGDVDRLESAQAALLLQAKDCCKNDTVLAALVGAWVRDEMNKVLGAAAAGAAGGAGDGDGDTPQAGLAFGDWLRAHYASREHVDGRLAALTDLINEQVKAQVDVATAGALAAALAAQRTAQQAAWEQQDRERRDRDQSEASQGILAGSSDLAAMELGAAEATMAENRARAAEANVNAAALMAKAADEKAKAAEANAVAAAALVRTADDKARLAEGSVRAAEAGAQAAEQRARQAEATARAAQAEAETANARLLDASARLREAEARIAEAEARAATAIEEGAAVRAAALAGAGLAGADGAQAAAEGGESGSRGGMGAIFSSDHTTVEESNTYINNQFVGLSKEEVKNLIADALFLYGADKTGRVDYALESAGGSVVSIRCSETYFTRTAQMSLFGIPLWYASNSPRTVIQPEVHPGQCWAFKGSQGYLVIHLAADVYISSLTLEHIPKALSPSNNIDSAPKEFSVWGLDSERDAKGTWIGNYTYEEDGPPLQHFLVADPPTRPFSVAELRIHSNHGNREYTCLYRFRVHGSIHRS